MVKKNYVQGWVSFFIFSPFIKKSFPPTSGGLFCKMYTLFFFLHICTLLNIVGLVKGFNKIQWPSLHTFCEYLFELKDLLSFLNCLLIVPKSPSFFFLGGLPVLNYMYKICVLAWTMNVTPILWKLWITCWRYIKIREEEWKGIEWRNGTEWNPRHKEKLRIWSVFAFSCLSVIQDIIIGPFPRRV